MAKTTARVICFTALGISIGCSADLGHEEGGLSGTGGEALVGTGGGFSATGGGTSTNGGSFSGTGGSSDSTGADSPETTGDAAGDDSSNDDPACAETLCGDECVDTMSNAAHCGGCDMACDEGDSCVSGRCGLQIPETGYCEPTHDWTLGDESLELQILELVNEERAQGASCGSYGSFGPAEPLEFHPALWCAARMHSLDMIERDFFAHDNPDGDGPGERMSEAGYEGRGGGENIAAGNSTAEETMQQWMGSDGHCSNIMDPNYRYLGVGYATDGSRGGHYWTQNFGR